MAEEDARRIEKAVAYGDVPRGVCFRFWQTGSCPLRASCKYNHIANPKPDIGQAEDGGMGAGTLMSTGADKGGRGVSSREGAQIAGSYQRDGNDSGIGNIPKGACFRFFSKNSCALGKTCKYSHSLDEVSVPEKTFPAEREPPPQHTNDGSSLHSNAQTLEAARAEERKKRSNCSVARVNDDESLGRRPGGIAVASGEGAKALRPSPSLPSPIDRTVAMLSGFTARWVDGDAEHKSWLERVLRGAILVSGLGSDRAGKVVRGVLRTLVEAHHASGSRDPPFPALHSYEVVSIGELLSQRVFEREDIYQPVPDADASRNCSEEHMPTIVNDRKRLRSILAGQRPARRRMILIAEIVAGSGEVAVGSWREPQAGSVSHTHTHAHEAVGAGASETQHNTGSASASELNARQLPTAMAPGGGSAAPEDERGESGDVGVLWLADRTGRVAVEVGEGVALLSCVGALLFCTSFNFVPHRRIPERDLDAMGPWHSISTQPDESLPVMDYLELGGAEIVAGRPRAASDVGESESGCAVVGIGEAVRKKPATASIKGQVLSVSPVFSVKAPAGAGAKCFYFLLELGNPGGEAKAGRSSGLVVFQGREVMGWYALLRVGGVCVITDLKLSKLDKGKATETVCWRATKRGDASGGARSHTVVLPVEDPDSLSQSVHTSTQGRRSELLCSQGLGGNNMVTATSVSHELVTADSLVRFSQSQGRCSQAMSQIPQHPRASQLSQNPASHPANASSGCDESTGGVVDYLGTISKILGDGVYELDGITRVFVSHMAAHTRGRGLRVGAVVRLMHVVPLIRGGELDGFGCATFSAVRVVAFSEEDAPYVALVRERSLFRPLWERTSLLDFIEVLELYQRLRSSLGRAIPLSALLGPPTAPGAAAQSHRSGVLWQLCASSSPPALSSGCGNQAAGARKRDPKREFLAFAKARVTHLAPGLLRVDARLLSVGALLKAAHSFAQDPAHLPPSTASEAAQWRVVAKAQLRPYLDDALADERADVDQSSSLREVVVGVVMSIGGVLTLQDETGAARFVVPSAQAIAVGDIVMLSGFTMAIPFGVPPHPQPRWNGAAAPTLHPYIQAPATLAGASSSDAGLRRLVHSSLSLPFPRHRVEGEQTIVVDAVLVPAKAGGEGGVQHESGFEGGGGRASGQQRRPAAQTRVHGWMLTTDESHVSETSARRASGSESARLVNSESGAAVLADGYCDQEAHGPSGGGGGGRGATSKRSAADAEGAARGKRQRVGSVAQMWTKVDVMFGGLASRHAAVMVPGGVYRMRGLDLIGASDLGITVYAATETSAVGAVSLAPHARAHENLGPNADEAATSVPERGGMMSLYQMREALQTERKEIGVDCLVALPPEKLAGQLHCVRAVLVQRHERAGTGERERHHFNAKDAPPGGKADHTTLCLRCVDVATVEGQRRYGDALRGRVDIYLDRSKWFVPLGLLPGATVLFVNLQARIGGHGSVYCLVGALTFISVESPAPPGWKEPQIATAAYPRSERGTTQQVHLSQFDPFQRTGGLLLVRGTLHSGLKQVSIELVCKACNSLCPGEASVCKARCAEVRGVPCVPTERALIVKAEGLLDDGSGRCWVQFEGVDLVLGDLLGASKSVSEELQAAATRGGRVAYERGVPHQCWMVDDASTRDQAGAYSLLEDVVEQCRAAGRFNMIRFLCEHRPRARPSQGIYSKTKEVHVGLISHRKRSFEIKERSLPQVRALQIQRPDIVGDAYRVIERLRANKATA